MRPYYLNHKKLIYLGLALNGMSIFIHYLVLNYGSYRWPLLGYGMWAGYAIAAAFLLIGTIIWSLRSRLIAVIAWGGAAWIFVLMIAWLIPTNIHSLSGLLLIPSMEAALFGIMVIVIAIVMTCIKKEKRIR